MASRFTFKRFIFSFIAGFIATLVFHQGMLAILYGLGFTARAPFPMQPAKPFYLPVVVSLALWGGVWGLLFAAVEPRFPRGAGYWFWALIFGALGPTLLAWFLVAALKGRPLGGGWRGSVVITGLLVNGAWGLGTGLLLRAFSRSPK